MVSCVLPAFNEASKLTWDIPQLHDFLGRQPFRSEILIVDDGSTDNTAEVASQLSVDLSDAQVRVRALSYGENRGKGHAVRFGILRAEGSRVAFMDVGRCVPPPYLLVALEKLDAGFDLAIASRRLPGSRVMEPRPIARKVGSFAFRWITQVAMGVHATDTQCGFKAFRREAARALFSRVETEGFMFDVELLLLADRLGLRRAEFAVEWAGDGDSRFHPLWGTIRNAEELLKIRMRNAWA